MAAAIEAQGPPYGRCLICKKLIGEGQWEVHARGGVFHHACHSHGSPQPIEVPERV